LKIKSYHKKTIKNSTNLNYGVIPIYERYPKQMAKKRIYETLLHNGYTIDNFGTFSVFCKQRFCNDLNTSIVYQLVNRLGTDNYGTKEDFIKNLSDKK
jgi:hypothetical protein